MSPRVIVTMHVLVPLQPPLQPARSIPSLATASVSEVVPWLTNSLQVLPQ